MEATLWENEADNMRWREQEAQTVKQLKRIVQIILLVPLILIGILILYELFGMCVNHLTTARQTKQLVTVLEEEVPDIELIDVHSETGNTSGTGNHVDCLTLITFSTEMQQSELEEKLYRHYEYDEWMCYLAQIENGDYLFRLNTSAPFAGNIEGH